MSRVRVLVVDDDAAVRRSLSTALGRDGYEVQAADGGAAALAHLAAAAVDAVVLAVALPEPNGLEVCRRLRTRGDRTPILMLTARDLVDDRVAGLAPARTTIWSSRSPWPSCVPGCARLSAAMLSTRSYSATATWCSTWPRRG
jgi:CheY-like chemotaxis protein